MTLKRFRQQLLVKNSKFVWRKNHPEHNHSVIFFKIVGTKLFYLNYSGRYRFDSELKELIFYVRYGICQRLLLKKFRNYQRLLLKFQKST